MSHLATVTETTGYVIIGKTNHDLSIGPPTAENRFPLILKRPPPPATPNIETDFRGFGFCISGSFGASIRQ